MDSLIDKLRNGLISAHDLPTIQVVSQNGKLWSIDNRRLLAFNTAGIEKVPVEIASLDDMLVARRFEGRFNPIAGQGKYAVVVPRAERPMVEQELKQYGLIKDIGIKNDY